MKKYSNKLIRGTKRSKRGGTKRSKRAKRSKRGGNLFDATSTKIIHKLNGLFEDGKKYKILQIPIKINKIIAQLKMYKYAAAAGGGESVKGNVTLFTSNVVIKHLNNMFDINNTSEKPNIIKNFPHCLTNLDLILETIISMLNENLNLESLKPYFVIPLEEWVNVKQNGVQILKGLDTSFWSYDIPYNNQDMTDMDAELAFANSASEKPGGARRSKHGGASESSLIITYLKDKFNDDKGNDDKGNDENTTGKMYNNPLYKPTERPKLQQLVEIANKINNILHKIRNKVYSGEPILFGGGNKGRRNGCGIKKSKLVGGVKTSTVVNEYLTTLFSSILEFVPYVNRNLELLKTLVIEITKKKKARDDLKKTVNNLLKEYVYSNEECGSHGCITLGNQLGEGNFGTVNKSKMVCSGTLQTNYNCTQQKPIPVAIKVLNPPGEDQTMNKLNKEDFINEAVIMATLQLGTTSQQKISPNVVRFLAWVPSPEMICLEFCDMGSLDKQLETLYVKYLNNKSDTPISVIQYMIDVAKGMAHVHSKGIVHLDLAARNILISKGTAKVSDFGMSKVLNNGKYIFTGGKQPWMTLPPELAVEVENDGEAHDVWSFGVTMWETMSWMQYTPYDSRTYSDIKTRQVRYKKIYGKNIFDYLKDGGRLKETWETCPPVLYQIMTFCWNKTPADRPNFKELISLIEEALNIIKKITTIGAEDPTYLEFFNVIQSMNWKNKGDLWRENCLKKPKDTVLDNDVSLVSIKTTKPNNNTNDSHKGHRKHKPHNMNVLPHTYENVSHEGHPNPTTGYMNVHSHPHTYENDPFIKHPKSAPGYENLPTYMRMTTPP
jgi:serine/threonine protein kinase